MKLNPLQLRQWLLAAALLLSVAAALWMGLHDEEEAPSARPARTRARATRTPESAPQLQLQSLTRASQTATDGEGAFVAQSWQAPPAPPPVVVAPAPSAPPLPFVYAGQLVNGKLTTVFLLHGGETLFANRGDTLLGTYLVDDVRPTALVLTYLPLKQSQVLSIGEMN